MAPPDPVADAAGVGVLGGGIDRSAPLADPDISMKPNELPFISRFLILLALYLGVVGGLASLSGCAKTPRGQYEQAEITLTAASNATRSAVASGAIKDPAAMTILRVTLIEAGAALDKAHEAIKTGKPTDGTFYTQAALEAAQRVLQYLAELEAKK